MTRRGAVGRVLATGTGAALAAGLVPVAAAGQGGTPVASDEASTIETVSGQALYTLPRDHRWHGGMFYTTSEYWEWHYWTAFVTDVESGEEWGALLHDDAQRLQSGNWRAGRAELSFRDKLR